MKFFRDCKGQITFVGIVAFFVGLIVIVKFTPAFINISDQVASQFEGKTDTFSQMAVLFLRLLPAIPYIALLSWLFTFIHPIFVRRLE